jgi:hypothetical protein
MRKGEKSLTNVVGGGEIFILQNLLKNMLEGEIVTTILHFEDAAPDEEPAGDDLSDQLGERRHGTAQQGP